ncbi:MAG: DMT family transporter [Bacteroidia bacterium]|nr:DMT family transporter [Bacteroidia bacterium]
MKKPGFYIYIVIILSMIFWSLSFVWYKVVYKYFEPISVIFLRLVISTLLLLLTALFLKKLQKLNKADLKMMLLLAFLEPFCYFLGESFGIKFVSSTVAAVFISTIPLFSPIVAHYFLKEKLTLMNFLGILLSLTGVSIVVFNNHLEIEASFPGICLLFLAVLSAIFYSVVSIRLSLKYNAFTIITYQNAIGIFYFLPLFLIFDFRHLISHPPGIESLIPLFELAVFASSLAFICFTYGLKHLGINKANIFANLIPVLTAVFAHFMIAEKINLQKAIGILVVISGLLISQARLSWFMVSTWGKNDNS